MQSKGRSLVVVAQVIVLCALCGGACYVASGLFWKPRADEDAYCEFILLARKIVAEEMRSIPNAMNRIACDQTALFVSEHMPKTKMSPDRFALLDHSLKSVGSTKGLYCEFGVAAGESINYIAERIPYTIHGFDSFEGLPETWQPNCEKGTFAMSDLPKVRDNVKLYKGWFDKSLPVWAKENPGPIAFMHMDADLYSSTKTVFDILGDRVVPGTVIEFDEYFNYLDWKNGEFKAFKEFVESRQVEFEYLGYSHMQVSVRIVRIGSQSGK